jgi:prefoldin subunit 5
LIYLGVRVGEGVAVEKSTDKAATSLAR